MALVVLLVWGTDQVTKLLAVDRLVEGEPVPVVDGVLDLYLLYNPGAAFSLGTGATPLLTVFAVVVVVGVAVVARRLGSRAWALTLGVLMGGALGNLTDRLLREPGPLHGHVVDFLRLPRWPVFNVADMAVVTAAVLVVLLTLRGVGVDGSREGRDGTTDAPDAAEPDGAAPDGARDASAPDRPGDGDPTVGHDDEGGPCRG